ncbi:hypothetical protein [Proteus penneri]|uniref:hypothetical protein n=1 Tax=Proteus penneri TaxID=102862 RepID=UPI00090802D2|nr:hypothetical protein [Proteus penneri]
MAKTSKSKVATQKEITQKKQHALLQKNKRQKYNDPIFSSFVETTSAKRLPLTPQYLNEINYLYLIPQHNDYFNVPHVGMAYGTLFYGIPLACMTYINMSSIYKRIIFRIKAHKIRATHR